MLLAYMREERESLTRQIDLFSTGKAQFFEDRDGRRQDVTNEALARLRRQLAELESILAEAER